MEEKHMECKLMIRMTEAEKNRLNNYAQDNHLNISSLVRSLITDYLNEKEN